MSPRAKSGRKGREVHRHLLNDPRVQAWYDARGLRSRLSADTYLRQLGATLARLKLSPSEFVTQAAKEPEQLSGALVAYAACLQREGRLDSYIAKTFDGLRSWLRYRRVTFDGFPKLSPIRGETLELERVPTQEELRRVLDRLTARGRTTALLMAHTGVRPGVLGTYGAADGLTLEDLPELELGKRPEFTKVPFVLRVPARLSKTRRMYTTFGTQELSSALLAYLDERAASGEKLTKDSPVITVATFAATHDFHGKKGAGRFLTTKGIVFELREALSAGAPKGVTWRPYVLRGYCSTRLLLAESQGKVSRDLREAILGHYGGVAARYNVGKPWGTELLEDARAAYKRCEPFLSTVPQHTDTRSSEMMEILLRFVGVPQSELEKLDLADTPKEDLLALAEKYKGAGKASEPAGQRAVSVAEVGPMLEAGWEYVAPLGPDRAVLKGPGGGLTHGHVYQRR